MKTHDITTQAEVRAFFWETHTGFTRKPGRTQNDYPCDIRMAFCDFVESLSRSGVISEALARKVTL